MMRAAFGVAIVACLWMASPAGAGLFTDIYQGLYIISTPSGYPLSTTSDGSRVNGARSGRIQIQPNVLGRGYEVQVNRTFGVDSEGRPEVLDFGQFEIQLAGSTAATFGYTNRGFLIGTANVTASNLNYTLRGKSGVEDATLSGTLNVAENIEVDQFGFYELSLDVANTNSELTLNGSLGNKTQPENFDIGPISVKGNIFFDGFVALLASLGVDTTDLEQFTSTSAINQIIDQITQQVPILVAGEQVTNDSQLLSTPTAVDVASMTTTDTLSSQVSPSMTIPEPGTLLLIAMGAALWCRRR